MIQNHAQVPKRIYTLEEMRLNKVEPTALLSPTDDTLNGVRTVLQARGAQPGHGSTPATPCRSPHAHSPCRTHASSAALQGGAAAGVAALYFGVGLSSEQLGGLLVAVVFTYFADQVLA